MEIKEMLESNSLILVNFNDNNYILCKSFLLKVWKESEEHLKSTIKHSALNAAMYRYCKNLFYNTHHSNTKDNYIIYIKIV